MNNVKYILSNKRVLEVFELEPGIFVPTNVTVKMDKNSEIYLNKQDAQYANLLIRLFNGSKLSNYRSSPYYEYYIGRLAEEHPELLI